MKPQGNWEGQIILEELKEPNKKVIEDLFTIRQKKKKTILRQQNTIRP